ncbi:MAG: hypothetical protein JKY37_06845 [Nannocystaceae bacterium]|nr:hypothetical protein [Nannocystaceae bacterium]
MQINPQTLLVLATLCCTVGGCTTAVSNEPSVNGGRPVGEGSVHEPDVKPVADPLEVAVGSVLLEGDCPDPPGAAKPSEPASAPAKDAMPKPTKRTKRTKPGSVRAEAPMQGVAMARRACRQSTLQLTFDNRGTTNAKVSIVEITLRDVKTDSVVATLPSRMPSKWSEADNAYTAWDQSVAATSSARTSYKITPPSWSAVESKLDGQSSRGRTYDVEVSVEVDGVATTVRSPEFNRPPVVPMPPT